MESQWCVDSWIAVLTSLMHGHLALLHLAVDDTRVTFNALAQATSHCM